MFKGQILLPSNDAIRFKKISAKSKLMLFHQNVILLGTRGLSGTQLTKAVVDTSMLTERGAKVSQRRENFSHTNLSKIHMYFYLLWSSIIERRPSPPSVRHCTKAICSNLKQIIEYNHK